MQTDLIDGAACAASDLTARLRAELCEAQAQLALAVARGAPARGLSEAERAEVTTARILIQEKIAVLREMLDGLPEVATDAWHELDRGHRASA